MKLLMITRKVDKNDALAGFTYDWVKKIGQQVNSLKVICLSKGDTSGLPENVEIYSLGKEKGIGRIRRFIKFKILNLKLVPKVSGIFCHMNPEYTIAIWPCAKIFGKKIVAWYTHKSVTWKTKLLVKMADVILTASKESFRVPSKKVIITGHGIDTEKFKPAETSQYDDQKFKIVSIGRISPTKDYESLIKAVDALVDRGLKNIFVQIIGGPGLVTQKQYFESLKEMVKKMDLANYIEFVGPVPHSETVSYLQQADLFVNLSETGSVDKAVLETMACGCLCLTSNEAFTNILGADFMVEKDDPINLAQKIKWVMDLPPEKKKELSESHRQIVVQQHNLDQLVRKIIDCF
jgi:glycosyltransferase involved in cell wall biosynthesis